MNVIFLPATGKHISLGNYVKAWKLVKANPHEEFKHGLNTWWPQLGREILADFRAGMHDRINNKKPITQ